MRIDCIWKDICDLSGEECAGCEYYDSGSEESDIRFYEDILKENTEIYRKLIEEFSDEEYQKEW